MAAAEHARAPNVVLITIDTLRADRVGCYGYQQARTATLDNLARDGVAFRTVVVSSPLTFPSHCSILTGTSPPVHGVRDNVGYRFSGRPPTLAQVLSSQHYATGAFVGAYLLDKRRGLGQGFETYASPFRGTLENSLVNNLQSAQRRAEEVIADARNRITSLLAQAGGGCGIQPAEFRFHPLGRSHGHGRGCFREDAPELVFRVWPEWIWGSWQQRAGLR